MKVQIGPSGAIESIAATTIFLTFDKPTQMKQVIIEGEPSPLPHYEVKDYSERHAIVRFRGGLDGFEVTIRADN
jgi:hypothetical protein